MKPKQSRSQHCAYCKISISQPRHLTKATPTKVTLAANSTEARADARADAEEMTEMAETRADVTYPDEDYEDDGDVGGCGGGVGGCDGTGINNSTISLRTFAMSGTAFDTFKSRVDIAATSSFTW